MSPSQPAADASPADTRVDPRPSASAFTDRVYALIGPDGAGKTTIALQVARHLEVGGAKTRIAWMRWPRMVTLGVLAFLRLSRLAKTARLGEHDDVHVDLRGHAFLFQLYAWSVTFDYFLGYLGKVTVPKRLLRRTVICDRFVWDALVDLGLASGLDEGFLEFPQGRILLGLAQKHRTVLVTASAEELLRRRPILTLDPRLARRLRLYRVFAGRFGIGIIDSGTTPERESVAEVMRDLEIPAS